MKVFNEYTDPNLTAELAAYLQNLRLKKNFNAKEYVYFKTKALHNYLKTHQITAAVIGVSGGIDSSVTLGLLAEVKKLGYLQEIFALSIPALTSQGAVTNQREATQKGQAVIKHFQETPRILDLSQTLAAAKEAASLFNLNATAWSNGQLVPNLRTSLQYYLTSLLSEQGHRAVVVGTINRDEGSYLGYMGKAGDSLVDIQAISDLHKSEVYSLGRYFAVPESIMLAPPTGDMHDQRTDEEVFGASYDFVELYLHYLSLSDKLKFWSGLSENSQTQFLTLQARLEKLHAHNAHKYISSSAAIHLDLFNTYVEGGWKHNSNYQKEVDLNPNLLVNFQTLREDELKRFDKETPGLVITPEETDWLLGQIKSWSRAGVDGYKDPEGHGSLRATFYSHAFADLLFSRLSLKPFKEEGGEIYRLSGLSPSLRIIRYLPGGKLVPHYDSSYEYSPKKKTLESVVICLKAPLKGGATRFIKETRLGHQFKDWSEAENVEVTARHQLQEGQYLIFPHQTLHDGEEVREGEKIIIRTDLVYEKV